MSSPTTPLPTRRIGDPGGDRGLDVSLVGLGCNNFGRRLDLEGTRDVLDAALDAGITLFDTADIYGGGGASETLMGEALEGRRDRFVLTTKFGMEMRGINGVPGVPRGSAEYIRWAVEGSLRRLRTDFIDLYQYHQPDGVTPMAETLEAMSELVDEGKVGFIGCSNFSAAQLEEAESVARERGIARFVTLQNEYSLLEREIEAEVQPTCGASASASSFFPLASGLLSGSTVAARARRGDPARPRLGRDRRAVQRHRGAHRVRPCAWHRAARRRDRRTRGAARHRVGDRGSDQARAGRGERRRAPLGADRRGPRRARPDRSDAALGARRSRGAAPLQTTPNVDFHPV